MNIGVSSKLALASCSFKVDIHRKKSYQIVNAWVFPLTFYNLGKCSKTHRIGGAWEIGTHTFLIALVHFFYQIPMFWYTSSYVKCMGCPINLPFMGKWCKTHRAGRAWEMDIHYFPLVWALFFPLDSHAMVYFIICEIHGFPNPFSIAWENTAKSIKVGEPGKLVPMIFS